MPELTNVLTAGDLEAGARRKKAARKSRKSRKSARKSVRRSKRTASGRRSYRKREYPVMEQRAPFVSPAQLENQQPMEVITAPAPAPRQRFTTRRPQLTPLVGQRQPVGNVPLLGDLTGPISPLTNNLGQVINPAAALDFSTPAPRSRGLLGDITSLFTGTAAAAAAVPVGAAAAAAAPVAAAARVATDPFAGLLGGRK